MKMFLSAVYNMEGSSNQNYIMDDNLIINGVRSRKKISVTSCCPVCSCTLRGNELEAHFNLELDRLNKLSCNGKRKLSSGTSLQNMPSSSSFNEYDEVPEVSNGSGSDVFQRVRQSRLKRLRRSRRYTDEPQCGECPVCGSRLPVSRLQRHALRCLKRTGATIDSDDDLGNSTTDEDASIDVENDEPTPAGFGAEYSWCGVDRVRPLALESAETRACVATAVRRVSQDTTALVVDGDEDLELYGPPQYSPSRIAPESAAEETSAPRDPVDSTEAPAASATNRAEAESTPARKYNGLVEACAETRIQALKVKIKELEQRQAPGNESKCLICLGGYTSPAVSIQCWHVHCETCWLDSLRAKKICPQCNAITTAQHLRRIYM